MKKWKKLLSVVLAILILANMNLTAFANSKIANVPQSQTSESNAVIITNSGIYINGIYYSQSQFSQLLDTAQEVQTPKPRSAIALVAGTWCIPGVGQVVITAAGVVLVAGATVAVGTWTHKMVTKWFAVRAFNKSAENAINGCNKNKQHHIMNSKHNWNKFNKNPKWSDIAPILIKVLKDGSETRESGDKYIRTLVYQDHTVVVRFIKDADGLVKHISTAWCK